MFLKEKGSRLQHIQLDGDGAVDWTSFEHGVGVWAVKAPATLICRFLPEQEVELPPLTDGGVYDDDWKIKGNHSPEDAELTNGASSYKLWALFRRKYPGTRKITLDGAAPAISGVDTMRARRRLIRRVSSNPNPPGQNADSAQAGDGVTVVRFSRNVRPRGTSATAGAACDGDEADAKDSPTEKEEANGTGEDADHDGDGTGENADQTEEMLSED